MAAAICKMCVRSIYLSASNLKNDFTKQARVMDKLLNRNKRKKYFSAPITGDLFTTPVGNTRRAIILSNLFMENITDVMSTGECGSSLHGYGIEITHVKVMPDCKIVNVFWTISSSNFDQVQTVSKLLKACAGEIRSEMTRQQVMGIVPYINFVQDRVAKQAAEVERLLSVADYGPDYIPVHSCTLLFPDTTNDVKEESTKSQKAFASKENESEQETYILTQSLDNDKQNIGTSNTFKNYPPMKTNVLGLDYNSLMNQVIRKMNSCRRERPETDVSETAKAIQWSRSNTVIDSVESKRNIALDNFLKDRKKQKAVGTMLPLYAMDNEDSQEFSESKKLSVEEEDYYDENDDDDIYEQDDDFNNK